MRRLIFTTITGCVCASWAGAAHAQNPLDRANPTIAERALPEQKPRDATPPPNPTDAPAVTAQQPAPAAVERIATAVVVEGAEHVPAASFSAAVLPYVGRNLEQHDLSKLTEDVANVARRRGYPFATASIAPQDLANGVLRVTVDEGRIDAVRVIGARNTRADEILTSRLANGRSVTRKQLERTIQLVDDIPGVDVKESRFTRQDGFGILLVTIADDKASGYIQVDNRGTKEVGPLRSTLIGSVRGVFQPGDELGLVASATPLQASEFAFARARYSSIVDRFGSVVSLSTAYGRARPGASLKTLDVRGNSVDLSLSYARPIERSRTTGLWASAEFRALKVDQSVLGLALRKDRLEILTASVNGFTPLAGGVLRGETGVAIGLPLAGVTHRGDPRASRADGDARFVTASYTFEWSRKVNDWVGLALGSSGQIASRPLLATAEIGVGGPGFGRAYDTAERTGDQGILGSAELRFDLGRLARQPGSRVQFYTAVDGGPVGNLRGGVGGGTLLSAAAGLRLRIGGFDAAAEIARPLNKDRFDTGDRRPRYSFRLARSF